MKKLFTAVTLLLALSFTPALAQEKGDLPMKEGMPMKGQGMPGSGMDMSKMKEMKGMGRMMGDMSGMMKQMSERMEVGG